jgi:hypothetical protein
MVGNGQGIRYAVRKDNNNCDTMLEFAVDVIVCCAFVALVIFWVACHKCVLFEFDMFCLCFVEINLQISNTFAGDVICLDNFSYHYNHVFVISITLAFSLKFKNKINHGNPTVGRDSSEIKSYKLIHTRVCACKF